MFSHEQLRDLIRGEFVGNKFPYDTNNEQEVEAHIRRLFYRINRIPNLICEAEWNHFGSGYASFIEFFCYRKEDVRVIEEKYGMREIEIAGMLMDVSRLAPVVILGEGERYQKIRIETGEIVSGASSSLPDYPKLSEVNQQYQSIEWQLKKAFEEFGYARLSPEKMNQPLPFKAQIPTNYREPREYLVMDAIFYWED